MKTAYDIIIEPIVTERSNDDMALGKYTFRVSKDANKLQIRQAVEELFSVKVLRVNTANFSGKVKRQGATSGKTPSWKKAIVTIDLDPKPEAYMGKGGKAASVSRKYKNTIEEFGFGG